MILPRLGISGNTSTKKGQALNTDLFNFSSQNRKGGSTHNISIQDSEPFSGLTKAGTLTPFGKQGRTTQLIEPGDETHE
jgi:hypothetical protein